jgi:hypothetical protein
MTPSLADSPKRTCRPKRRSHRPDSGAVAERDGAGRLDRVPGEQQQPMAFAPRRVQGTSSASERAFRAASRARQPARCSSAASSLRPASSCLSACASASAALCSSVSATRRNTDASSAARNRVFPTAPLAAAPGGSTASESRAPAIIAPVSRPTRSGVRIGISHAIASDWQRARIGRLSRCPRRR